MSIELKHIQYVYGQGTAYEKQALKDVSLEIPQGQFLGIIGHTGSGKSTLIQHFNGLIKAASGELYYEGKNIYEDGYDMKYLRSQVGLVFQYPEHQLFEVDVLTDVCSMEDIAKYVDRIIVMNRGEKFLDGTPREVFAHYQELEEVGLAAPQVTYIMHDLRQNGLQVGNDVTTVEEAADEIMRYFRGKHPEETKL